MQLLRKRHRRIIIAHLPRLLGLVITQRNAIVNIENPILATGAPNGSRRLDAILLGVHLTGSQRAAAYRRHARCLRLACVLREVVGRYEAAGHALVQARPTVVGCVDDCVLEPARVLEVEVQLAVFGAVGWSRAGPDVGLEGVEAVGYYLQGRGAFLVRVSILAWLHRVPRTVLSVEVLVDTEPWGHPLPEYVVSTMVIWSGEGAFPEVACGTGFAAARTGRRRRAASFECMLAVLGMEKL